MLYFLFLLLMLTTCQTQTIEERLEVLRMKRAEASSSLQLDDCSNPFSSIQKMPCTSSHHVQCSCCGYCGTPYSFTTIGAPSRFLAECPKCKSRERHRASCQQLGNPIISSSLCKKQEGKFHLLHFGPEQYMAAQIEKLTAVDQIRVDFLFQAYARRYGVEKHIIYKADVRSLMFPDNFIDGIINLHVLEHVDQTMKSLHELSRVLRPGGWMLIEVPCEVGSDKVTQLCGAEFHSRICMQKDHVWNFSCDDFEKKLKEAEFKCTSENQWLPYATYKRAGIGEAGRMQPQWLCFKS